MGLLWARTVAIQGPLLCLLNAMHWPLDCHYVPVDCHMWASCLPHKCLLSATCGSHVGQTTATRGPALQNKCGPHVSLRWEPFQLPHVALCGPLVECLLGCDCMSSICSDPHCQMDADSWECHRVLRCSVETLSYK